MTDDYTPYRIMKSFVVPGPNEKYLMTHFPGGKIKRIGRKRGWQSIYEFKSVVNSPTPAELGLFKASKHAYLIPQDPGGFDVRDSNLARSIKTSIEGRRKHLLVVAERKFADEEAMRKIELEKQKVSAPKPKVEPVPKPVEEIVVEVPELKIEPSPEMQTEPLPTRKAAGDFGDIMAAVHKKRDKEKEDAETGNPLGSGTEDKLEPDKEKRQFTKKKGKYKRKDKSDSDPNKLDDENQIKASKNNQGWSKKLTEDN